MLVQAVETIGYNAVGSFHGLDALEQMAKQTFDLVLTDIFMPHMNGIELLKRLRSDQNEIPVIFITGFDADDARQAAADYNAAALLLKPFRLAQLKNILVEILGE